jgi:putative transposase
MIRIHLDDATRRELNALRRSDLPATARDRSEMVPPSDAGWSPPRIAAHLGYHPPTVRDRLRDCLGRGTDALSRRRPGPAPDAGRRGEVTRALTEPLGEGRTWTGRQPSEALAGRGIALGPRQTRRYLKRLKAGYRRTTSALRHEPGPAKAGRAGRVLDNLRRTAAAGRLKPSFLDEWGFSPTLPTAYSWTLPGQRKRVEYEAPQGRRVNAPAAYRPYGGPPRLEVFTAERTWDSYDLLGVLKASPWAKVPRVVVPDNASPHTSKVVRAARRRPAAPGIYLHFLPPYSPELNEIEPVFRQVQSQEIPVRSHRTRSGLREAVESGFGGSRRRLRRKSPGQLRPAA